MSYILEHTVLGFCWWDLPALIVLLGVIVFFVVKRHNMKEEEKDLEDRLSEFYAEDTVEAEKEA